MKLISSLTLLTLFAVAPANAALALDYRVAAELRSGMDLIDVDAVQDVGGNRRMLLTVIFPKDGDDPAEVGVASVLVDCGQTRYSLESLIGYDTDLKEKHRQDGDGTWITAEADTPIFPAIAFVCRGKALPKAESQDLKTIVDGYLRRAAGEGTN